MIKDGSDDQPGRLGGLSGRVFDQPGRATARIRAVKAAVCHAFGEPLVIVDVSLPPPGPNQLRVELAACAICHSDIAYAEGAWGGKLPAVYGHEASGRVAETGDGVDDLAVGDHVVVTLIRSCGECRYCRRGYEVACSATLEENNPLRDADGNAIHPAMQTGAFAEEVVVHRSQVVVIKKRIPLDAAALLGCGVITGVGSVTNVADVQPGWNVVVVGTGGVGLNVVQGAVLAGAVTIVAVDLSADKLAAARMFGATHTVNPSTDDAVEAVSGVTDGEMADAVFVTVPAKEAFDGAPVLLAPTGAVVLVGLPATGVMTEIDPLTLADQSQRVLGSKLGAARISIDIPKLVELYEEGRLKLDELITGRYPLDEINEAIASVDRGEALRHLIVF